MSKIIIKNDNSSRIVYLTLLSAAGALIVLILLGTIFGLIRSRNAPPVFTLGRQTGTQQIAVQNDDIRVFSGLGRLRIPLADSSTLLLSIAFPYSASDVTFTEELAARIGDFRTITTSYFTSLPAENIDQFDEDETKQELLRRFNASLRLGRIETLYFSDMMIINSAL
ncbi:MAG: hypothetical protein FWD14_05720 [Treponema sp.]|nr:hypothetical protein [Treponema sp.]